MGKKKYKWKYGLDVPVEKHKGHCALRKGEKFCDCIRALNPEFYMPILQDFFLKILTDKLYEISGSKSKVK